MGKGYKHGGSNPLNFKVVPGLTQPGTASENTIWVKTEKIGAWYFSATQPEGLQEWDVWFPTGTSSTVEFNALKKNGIQVYPISAKQYVNSTLVDVTAMSYQNGEWGEWIPPGALYWHGDQRTDLTGGWAIRKTSGTNLSQASCTFGNEKIKVVASSGQTSSVLSTSNKIDVTNAKKVSVKITINNLGTSNVIRMYAGNSINTDEGGVATIDCKSTGVVDLDVSAVSGSYYVGFYIRTNSAIDFEISEVFYE